MISRVTGENLDTVIATLPEAIQMRLVRRIEICFKRGETFPADVALEFDWQDFWLDVHENGARMPLAAGSKSTLPDFMIATIEVCERIVAELFVSTEADAVKIWWKADSEAIEKYGIYGIRQRQGVGLEPPREKQNRDNRKLHVQHTLNHPVIRSVSTHISIYRE